MVRVLVARLRHGGDKFLTGVLLNAHTHLFAEWNMLIPGLLQLPTPVAAMQNIIQRRHGFDHQEMAHRCGLRGSDFALIDKTQFCEELYRIFTCATGHPLHTFLTRDRLQRHRHQRAEPFILYGGVDGHKTDRSLIISIDI